MKIIYVTDTHGSPEVYERALEEAGRKDIKAVIIGGDITPSGPMNISIPDQRDFLEKYLIPLLRDFRKSAGKPVFIMMGNDDFIVNLGLLESAEREGVLNLMHLKLLRLKGFLIGGYSCVNPIPFFIKDWEREDENIKKELEAIRTPSPGKTVYVFHVPPYGTKLDLLYSGEHAGSTAVREFIKEEKPLLGLHGHIHESPDMSGSITDRIGKTLCINPGDARPIVIDLSSPDKIESIEL
jgi:Icc-related predicted phosphoesterase